MPLPINAQFAALFPGQGSQAVGMATPYLENPETAAMLAEANEILGFDLTALMQNGPEDTLRETENAQVALFMASVCAVRLFEIAEGRPFTEIATVAAGHSVGEYAALCAAGVFEWQTGLRLVRARGEAMANCTSSGAFEGTMAAIIGLDMPTLAEICAEAGCFVANDNTEGQVILSGETGAVATAMEAAKTAGAKRALPLNVSGPFHTPLMAQAAEAMAKVLADVTFKDAAVPVILNTTAAPTQDSAFMKEQLVQQITAPVRWRETMLTLQKMDITHAAELGSGKVLSGMAKRGLVGVELV